MPRLYSSILDCSIYLYPSVKDAEQGRAIGGSGFLLRYDFKNPPEGFNGIHAYAVTNRHVVQGEKDGAPVVRVNTLDGYTDIFELQKENWYFDLLGNDLAVCPLKLQFEKHQIQLVNYTQLLSKDMMTTLDIGIGFETLAVGRFVTHEGKEQNLPVARIGNIAMNPIEPIYNHYLDMPQESFLVECHSISGYSGSPIFLLIRQTTLLGVVWGHMEQPVQVYVRDGRSKKSLDNTFVDVNTGMMTVVPAWVLKDFLDSDELAMQRQQIEDEALRILWKQGESAAPDAANELDE